ncbi:hypothetical protein [Agrobacterium rosae]|uniref:hypothetical protein n=1 Tax=Agrobacterium rosae TaxID=1972867 RepID=UPI003A7F8287
MIFKTWRDRKNIDEMINIIKPYFDTEFYKETYQDVAKSGIDPLRHYILYGAREGRNPSRFFDSSSYMAAHPETQRFPNNPLLHYIKNSSILSDVSRDEGQNPFNGDADLALTAQNFDAEYYLNTYPDVKNAKVDPLEHFYWTGWKEKRNPSDNFDTQYYLSNYELDNDINPLLHYLKIGKKKGYIPVSPIAHSIRQLQSQQSLKTEMKDWVATRFGNINADELADKIGESPYSKNIICFTHDDYRNISGGVQLCIQKEVRIANENDYNYIVLFPSQPKLMLDDIAESENFYFNVAVNDEMAGTISNDEIVKASMSISKKSTPKFVIHHLLGHRLETVEEIIHVSGADICYYWIHDYFGACTNFTLQRNSVKFCGAPEPSSNSCSICRYGDYRATHVAMMRRLFDRVKMVAIAPSEVAMENFDEYARLPLVGCKIVPHQTFVAAPALNGEFDDSGKIKIGFSGTPASHKGWSVFELLFKQFENDPRFEFFYFGDHKIRTSAIKHIQVTVSEKNPSAMVQALRENRCDFVIHWASWPETFSFSTFEAINAGAFIVTNEGSGNVAKVVRKTGRGAVLKGVSDLVSFFAADDVIEIAHGRRVLANEKPLMSVNSRYLFDVIDGE